MNLLPYFTFVLLLLLIIENKSISIDYQKVKNLSTSSHKQKLKTVIVTLCNDAYISHAAGLVRLIRTIGAYEGPIVVLYTESQTLAELSFKEFNVSLKKADDLLPYSFKKEPPPPCERDEGSSKRIRGWKMYYTKATIFSTYFKAWDRILWMDARTNVHRPLVPFFHAIDSTGVLFANPDAWPEAVNTLSRQFYSNCNELLFENLSKRFDLSREYFQSGLMLFDSNLIDSNTLRDILILFHEYPEIVSGDQPLFSLYWDQIRGVYKQLPYRLPQSLEVPYDFSQRISTARYITTAWRP
jgi:hypothetical protein